MATRHTETSDDVPPSTETGTQPHMTNEQLKASDLDATGLTASQGLGGLGGVAVGGTDLAGSTPVTAMPGGDSPQGAFGASVRVDMSGTEAGTGGLRGMGGVYSTKASEVSVSQPAGEPRAEASQSNIETTSS